MHEKIPKIKKDEELKLIISGQMRR